MINAGSVFKFVFAILKTFMTEKTRNKVSIEGTDFINKLSQLVDIQNLPTFLGGTCTCSHVEGGCQFSDPGPWSCDDYNTSSCIKLQDELEVNLSECNSKSNYISTCLNTNTYSNSNS